MHCKRQGSEKSTFLAIFWGFWFCQDRLLSRNSTRKPFTFKKNPRFLQTPLVNPLVFTMHLVCTLLILAWDFGILLIVGRKRRMPCNLRALWTFSVLLKPASLLNILPCFVLFFILSAISLSLSCSLGSIFVESILLFYCCFGKLLFLLLCCFVVVVVVVITIALQLFLFWFMHRVLLVHVNCFPALSVLVAVLLHAFPSDILLVFKCLLA